VKIYKTVLLGEGGVGKTALRYRYLGQGFKENYSMTIGADFAVKRQEMAAGDVTAQIWDLAGQPQFANVRSVYYKGAVGALLVFDITRPDTYKILPTWLNELIQHNNETLVPVVLIGNKADLRGSSEDEVPFEAAAEYAKALSDWSGYSVPYLETSAKSGHNVDLAFVQLFNNISAYLEQFRPKES
jgi:small GTP-binding protein